MASASDRIALQRAPAQSRLQFEHFAWAVLAWNLLVVLWGALVRATGSGAGCGSHWPLCNGVVVPQVPELQTIIEFTHRLMSGVALIAVAALYALAFRHFPPKHTVRHMAALSVLFLFLEALLGAGLVLFEYVGQNESVGRVIYLSAHLVNTQLLLAVLALTAWFARPGWTRPIPARVPALLKTAIPLALLVSVTGAIAALGDTLFPAPTLSAAIRQDFSTAANLLLRLRIFHPALAIISGAFILAAAITVLRGRVSTQARTTAWTVAGLVGFQLCLGALNLLLLAPVWIQLSHLLIADVLWIALVLLTAESRTTIKESNI